MTPHDPHQHHTHKPATRPDGARLPRNQALVLDALQAADAPRTAYELLEDLRDEGMRAPLSVYRALDGLRERGLVHKIESLKAFVACCEDDHDERPAFAVCDRCGTVVEFEDPDLADLIGRIAARTGFTVQRAMVELMGTCERCRKQPGEMTEPRP